MMEARAANTADVKTMAIKFIDQDESFAVMPVATYSPDGHSDQKDQRRKKRLE